MTVADVDATAARSGAGGTVIVPPFDVMDAGRMAVIADPTGAMFNCGRRRTTSARSS